MKTSFAFLPTLIFCASSALAADGTWTNNDSSDWSTTSNWTGSTVADGAGFLADFSTIDITAARTVTLDSSRTIGRLIFGDTAWTNSGFDWTLASSGASVLTLDNAGGVGGNPPTITVANRGVSIGSVLAGNEGLNLAMPWSNWDVTRGTSATSLTFTADNTLSGALHASGGTVRLGGTDGRFGSATALTIAGNGVFINGDATAANNNGITNRLGDGTATLTLGGASGGGTFTSAFAASANVTSQTFAGLTVNVGNSVLNSSNTAAGTNDLIVTGSAGAGYVRNANGLLNVVTAAGFNPQFTNAPTDAGGSSVSGTGGNAILIGALLNGTDFITAAGGSLTAATYTDNAADSLTSGANINITVQNTTLASSSTVSINSLKFSDNAARTLNLGTGSGLTIAGGGILTGSAVATNGNTITGGTITSGTGDLWIYANGSGLSDIRDSKNALGISSQITGSISLTVGGGQKISLGGANDYTEGTFLNNGKIIVAADSSLGAANGAVTAVSGGNSIRATGTIVFNANRNFVINSGASLALSSGANTIAGQISGGGQLVSGFVSDGNRLTLTGANSGFTGQYQVSGYLRADEGTGLSSNANLLFRGRNIYSMGVLETSGSFTRALGSGAGQVQWSNLSQYGSGGFAAVGGALSVNLGGNVTPDTLTWGSGHFLPNSNLVLGSGAATHDVTFQNPIALNGASRAINVVASGSTKAIMSGDLSGNASSGINKKDNGTLVLTGNNTYEGATTVSAGTLSLVGGSQASPITVNSGATLGFTLGSPTTSTSTVTFSGLTAKVSVTGTPVAATLMTTTAVAGITGTPVLDPAIPGYSLAIEDSGTTLKLKPDGITYAAWQSANTTSQTIDQDHDNDGVSNGVEFFIGGPNNTTGFTPQPAITGTSVTYAKHPDYPGAYDTAFVIETSETLVGAWTPETVGGNVVQSGDDFIFTFPSGGPAKKFVRLKVTGP